jgi:hypothetical protein
VLAVDAAGITITTASEECTFPRELIRRVDALTSGPDGPKNGIIIGASLGGIAGMLFGARAAGEPASPIPIFIGTAIGVGAGMLTDLAHSGPKATTVYVLSR